MRFCEPRVHIWRLGGGTPGARRGRPAPPVGPARVLAGGRVVGVVLAAAVAALALALALAWGQLPAGAGAAGGAASVGAAGPAATRELTLTAQEVEWDLFPGTTVRAWTYNGTVPGPEIRATEGDLVLQREFPG